LKKTKKNPSQLEILGDGTHRKIIPPCNDGITAILLAISNSESKTNIFNLGNKE
jgi:hypothetical protein